MQTLRAWCDAHTSPTGRRRPRDAPGTRGLLRSRARRPAADAHLCSVRGQASTPLVFAADNTRICSSPG
eukprot:5403438-Prymnesium_polylepis.1